MSDNLVRSCLGYEYNLKEALRSNPTVILAGDDISAVALARIEELEGALAAERAALRAEVAVATEALIEAEQEILWDAYSTGHERDGKWTHMFMSDGEHLVRECGFDPTKGYYLANEIKEAIPAAAKRLARARIKGNEPEAT